MGEPVLSTVQPGSALPIECDDLTLSRGDFRLGPVSLSVGVGPTTLVGRNGAGKTTLLRSLVGLERPRGGQVSINGMDPYDRAARSAVMRQIGYVPQGADVPGAARVADIVSYCAWLKGVPRREATAAVGDALREVSITEFGDRRARTLSGGERQRVSIAMALVHRPSVLILDEPTVGLDPVQRLQLRENILELARTRAVVLTTHLVEDIGEGDGAVVAMAAGKVSFVGSADSVRQMGTESGRGATPLERGLWRVLGGDEG